MLKELLFNALLVSGLVSSPTQHQLASKEVSKIHKFPEPTVIIGYIQRIECETNDNRVITGTAFYIGNDTFITANHVVEDRPFCRDSFNQQEMVIDRVSKKHDFATIKFKNISGLGSHGMKINCNGFKSGRKYSSFGYALGTVFVMNNLKATGKFTKPNHTVENKPYGGMRELKGMLVQGMSGGPIVDDLGYVVGINNVTADAGTKAFSYELKDTFLCKSNP